MFHYTLRVAPVIRRIGDHLLEGRVERAIRQPSPADTRLLLTEHMTDIKVRSAVLGKRERPDGSLRRLDEKVSCVNDTLKEQRRRLSRVWSYREDRACGTSDELLCG